MSEERDKPKDGRRSSMPRQRLRMNERKAPLILIVDDDASIRQVLAHILGFVNK